MPISAPQLEHSRSHNLLLPWGSGECRNREQQWQLGQDTELQYDKASVLSLLWEILLPSSYSLHTSSCSFLPVSDSLSHDVIITPSAEAHGESLPVWLKEGMETFQRNISLYN